MDNISFWISIFSIIIPVFATLYTVNNRIKNENKENHKPYLVLRKIISLDNLNVYKYYLTLTGKNYRSQNIDNEKQDENSNISVEFLIRNIGYGVATNIKFYDLLTGDQVKGTQEIVKEQNQKLFTTFDIASNEEKEVQAAIHSLVKDEDGVLVEDHNRILCVYQDLNGNVYNFIITINIKDKEHYDFFAYQRSSRSYHKWIKENKKQYKMIMKKYGN